MPTKSHREASKRSKDLTFRLRMKPVFNLIHSYWRVLEGFMIT